uniref:Variant surface glycoprotein 749 n=1 Tax=Trypanosoma brucei TaxID=5691 RepID=M4SXB3_9TRYP|nr:variant surface glycoprotein 749 [Trypanosoma brucei]
MSKKKHLVSLILVYAAASIKEGDAAPGDGKNIREFHILCSLVELCKKTPINLPGSSLLDDDVRAIELINMSASTDEWQNQFPTTDKVSTEKSKDCDKQPKPIKCHENYEKWRTAREQLEEPANKEIKQTPAKGIQTTAYGRRIQTQIAAIAIEAQGIYSDYKTQTATVLEGVNDKLRIHFGDALYGKQQRPLNGAPVDKWQASGTRATDCGATNAGLSLRGDLMCLCAQDSTVTPHMCGNTVTAAGGDWGKATVAGVIEGMASKCAGKAKPTISATYINQALAQFNSVLKSHTQGTKDAVILGTPHSTGACGGQASVACVDYTDAVMPKDQGRHERHKWYSELTDAAKELENYLTAIEQQNAAKKKIQQLKQEASRLFQTLKVQEPATNTAILQLPRIDPLELKKNSEQFHNNSKECTENGCKWKATDEKTGTCDVDETKVTTQANAGTGETSKEGAAATSGCARHGTDKTACENDKTGDKQKLCIQKG